MNVIHLEVEVAQEVMRNLQGISTECQAQRDRITQLMRTLLAHWQGPAAEEFSYAMQVFLRRFDWHGEELRTLVARGRKEIAEWLAADQSFGGGGVLSQSASSRQGEVGEGGEATPGEKPGWWHIFGPSKTTESDDRALEPALQSGNSAGTLTREGDSGSPFQWLENVPLLPSMANFPHSLENFADTSIQSGEDWSQIFETAAPYVAGGLLALSALPFLLASGLPGLPSVPASSGSAATPVYPSSPFESGSGTTRRGTVGGRGWSSGGASGGGGANVGSIPNTTGGTGAGETPLEEATVPSEVLDDGEVAVSGIDTEKVVGGPEAHYSGWTLPSQAKWAMGGALGMAVVGGLGYALYQATRPLGGGEDVLLLEDPGMLEETEVVRETDELRLDPEAQAIGQAEIGQIGWELAGTPWQNTDELDLDKTQIVE